MFRRLLIGAGFGLGLATAAASGAAAAPLTFTWLPMSATPPLNGGPITADNMVVSDVAAVTIPGGASGGPFTETAILPIVQFQLPPGTPLSPAPTGYDTNYSLYFTATLSGTQGAIPTVPGHATTFTLAVSTNSGPLC